MKRVILLVVVVAMSLIAPFGANARTIENKMQNSSREEKAFVKAMNNFLLAACPDVRVVVHAKSCANGLRYVIISAHTSDGKVLEGTVPFDGLQVRRIEAMACAFDFVFNPENYAME
jgi:hypothetical protein